MAFSITFPKTRRCHPTSEKSHPGRVSVRKKHMIQPKLNIIITESSNNMVDYVQIMSDDWPGMNIVLIANEIEVQDLREKSK